MYAVLSVVLYAFGVTVLPAVTAETVFGAESTGMYWGANINPDGRAATVKFPLYPGFNRTTGAVTYDPVSGQSLFELYHPHSIAFGPMCASSTGLRPQFLVNITDALLEAPELGETFAGKAKAFAMYNSKIYFLYYGSYFDDAMAITHKFQVRVLKSCEECGIDPYKADPLGNLALQFTVKCSDLVVELPAVEEDLEYDLGNVLKVVGSKDSDKLEFYFQIGRLNPGEEGSTTEMLLYHATSDNEVTQIHEQLIDNRYSSWASMVFIGAVDYLDGLLCWTTADRLFCRYDDQTHALVPPAAALTKGICKGSSPEHLADLSGVTILQGTGTKVILFGCSPETKEVRGAGIIRVSEDGSHTIEPLMAGEEKLSAASLLTIKTLPESCSFEPRPTLCVPLDEPTTAAPQASTTNGEVEPEVEEPKTETEPTEDPNNKSGEPNGEEGPDGGVVIGDGEKEPVGGGNDTNSALPVLQKLSLFQVLVLTVVLCYLWS